MLILSDITMLREFGIVTVVDLTVSLIGVLLVLPAALLWAEEHGPITLRDFDPRKIGRSVWEERPHVSRPRLPRPRVPRPRRPSFRLPRLRRRRGSRA